MAAPVVTVAVYGIPVVDVTATFPKIGLPVTEAVTPNSTRHASRQGYQVRYSGDVRVMVKLVEVEPNRWRVERRNAEPARSALPCPHVISDSMDPVEHVDGRFYTSKATYRAVSRAHGLIEIGNEKVKPRQRASARREEKEKRRKSLKLALDKYKAGHRSGQ